MAYLILVLITLIAYANAWPNTLTLDDAVFANSGRFGDLGIADLGRFFSENLWAASGSNSGLYRPLLLVLIAVESWVFGDWMSGYHLVNILLHTLATLLVYGLIRRLMLAVGNSPSLSGNLSLLAALIFAVHPAHAEVVNSIFNGSEILVTIGIVGGLSWFLNRFEKQALKAWLGLSAIYLLVLFCRESAASLPALAVTLIWLTSSQHWKKRLLSCLPVVMMLMPLGLYLAMRANAFSLDPINLNPSTGSNVSTAAASQLDMAQLGLSWGTAKILPAIVMWFDALKLLLWPHPLQIFYNVSTLPFWIALAAQLALLAAAVLALLNKRPLLLIGLAFFYLAILPSSRIIGEIGQYPILADRIVYLPSVGFAICLVFGLKWLSARYGPNTAVISTLLVVLILTPLTWARNADWSSDTRLLETDYKKMANKHAILNSLMAEHMRNNNAGRVVELCDAHIDQVRGGAPAAVHCGAAFGQFGRFRDAELAYLAATKPILTKVYAHFNLGMMYVHLGRKTEAGEQFRLAIEAEPRDFLQEYFGAIALIQLNPSDYEAMLNAKSKLQRSLEIQPQHVQSRQELDELNQRLQSMNKKG